MTGSALVRWRHPQTGEQFTFQDCRRGAKTVEPDDTDMLAAFEIIGKAMAETPAHEGRHAAVALLFDIPLAEARSGFPAEDGITGYIKFGNDTKQLDRLRLAEHAVVTLAGPVGEKAGPPAWPLRSNDGMASDYSDEKTLAYIVRRLDLNERQYDGFVDITRTIISHPGIKRVEDRIATLLNCGLTLSSAMLKDIHDGAWRETAEEAKAEAERNRPRTPAEIEDAELREHFRSWMTTRLEEGARYHDEQAERKAARDLRRRAMELAAEIEQTTTKQYQPRAMRTSVFPATVVAH